MLSVHFNFAASTITRSVAAASRSHAKAMESIATGYRINVSADGPADLIQSEKLRSQIDGLERAMQNASESNNILGIMEGALGQVQSIITRMSGLAIEAANSGVVSPDRIAANQAEVDAGLQAIDRIMETTSYGGRKLLGNLQKRGVLGEDMSAVLEAGKLLEREKENGRTPYELFTRDEEGKLYLLDPDGEYPDQLSNDGTTLAGDKTFVLPPAEEGGKPTELRFEKGAKLDDIVAALRKHGEGLPPQTGEFLDSAETQEGLAGIEGDFAKAEGVFGSRVDTNIDRVEMSAAQLASLAGMSKEDAASSLADYMNDFTRKIAIDFDGWNTLTDADKALLLTSDRMANLGMNDLASLSDGEGGQLTLEDMYSGGKASLMEDPAKAIELLAAARKSVTAERAGIAATQAMAQHGMNADAAALEATQRMESYLRDTRIDEAVTEMARTEIIQSTGMMLLKKSMEQYKESMLSLLA